MKLRKAKVRLMVIVVGCGAVFCVGVLILLLSTKPTVKPSAVASVASEPVVTTLDTMVDEFKKLKGKWVRPDGGYVLELKRLLSQNELEVAYFNPNPIHVGKAKLYKERGFIKVFVELQDVNYPGSTYTLIYDVSNDLLRGAYYQATQQQEYQIVFERVSPH